MKRSTNEVMARVLNQNMKKIDRVKNRFVVEGIEVASTGEREAASTLKKLTVILKPIWLQ